MNSIIGPRWEVVLFVDDPNTDSDAPDNLWRGFVQGPLTLAVAEAIDRARHIPFVYGEVRDALKPQGQNAVVWFDTNSSGTITDGEVYYRQRAGKDDWGGIIDHPINAAKWTARN